MCRCRHYSAPRGRRGSIPSHPIARTGLFGNVIDRVDAADGISFSIAEGRTLGFVGESGCGNSTAERTVLRLIEPSGGTIRFNGNDITRLPAAELRMLGRRMQLVFQDRYSSLNRHLGRIVEHTDKATIFARPSHPYTQALMAGVPAPDPAVRRTEKHVIGDVPRPINRPAGCHFHPRCPHAQARCRTEEPILREVQPGHSVACHLV
ncbi:MAG: ABC transporter ATP-binding protein [Rhodopila sp.]